MSETPLIDEETNNTNNTPLDPFADNLAMQSDLHENAAAAIRQLGIEEPEATVGAIRSPANTDQERVHLRMTPRGRAVAAAAVTTAIAAAVVTPIAVSAADKVPSPTIKTIEVTVAPGEGLEKIIEDNVPQVSAGQLDWRDVADTIIHLPQNSELTQPGHILQPGETIAIPVYTSEK